MALSQSYNMTELGHIMQKNYENRLDPMSQTLILFQRNGSVIPVALLDIQALDHEFQQTAIIYGTQFGATFILLMVLLLLTTPERRKKPVYVINCVSMVLNMIRLLTVMIFFLGPCSTIYAINTGDFYEVEAKDKAVSVISEIVNFLLLLVIEAALTYRVKVVYDRVRTKYRETVFAISWIVGLVAAGFGVQALIANVDETVHMVSNRSEWEVELPTILKSVMIIWFCAVFISRMAQNVYIKWRSGMKETKVMQVLILMTCNTFIVPAIFAALNFSHLDIPTLQSNITTSVVLFLPLTTLWVSRVFDDEHKSKALNTIQTSATNYNTTKRNTSGEGSRPTLQNPLPDSPSLDSVFAMGKMLPPQLIRRPFLDFPPNTFTEPITGKKDAACEAKRVSSTGQN